MHMAQTLRVATGDGLGTVATRGVRAGAAGLLAGAAVAAALVRGVAAVDDPLELARRLSDRDRRCDGAGSAGASSSASVPAQVGQNHWSSSSPGTLSKHST